MAIIGIQSSVGYFTNELKVFVKLIVKLKNDKKISSWFTKNIFLEVPPSMLFQIRIPPPDINPKREEQIHPSR